MQGPGSRRAYALHSLPEENASERRENDDHEQRKVGLEMKSRSSFFHALVATPDWEWMTLPLRPALDPLSGVAILMLL